MHCSTVVKCESVSQMIRWLQAKWKPFKRFCADFVKFRRMVRKWAAWRQLFYFHPKRQLCVMFSPSKCCKIRRNAFYRIMFVCTIHGNQPASVDFCFCCRRYEPFAHLSSNRCFLRKLLAMFPFQDFWAICTKWKSTVKVQSKSFHSMIKYSFFFLTNKNS